ncbi:MAG TPA: PIN domain-containing protein [Streptosporangiaceae bacterium]|nr:PIN domain-containing protein [Streptosporangiaceae bacterium]
MAGREPAPPGRVLVDTNVFLSATDQGRAEHRQALAILNEWTARGTTLYASGQIMREYLAVATRPVEANGLGLKQADAVANVRALRTRTSLLAEEASVADRLLDLLSEIPCSGKQVHDANVVATMLVHGIDSLVTINVTDFSRFGHLIALIPLQAAGRPD